MPIYEYECTCCPTRFELKRSFSDSSPVSCPQCGGSAQRVFSALPIIFKGHGFYCTDNKGNHGHSAPTEGADKADKAKTGSAEKDVS